MNSRILPTLALLVSVGIFFAYVQPTWSGPLAVTKASIASDDRALAAANTYTMQQNQLAVARNAIDPRDLTRLARFLPGSVDNVGLILDLNALAARSGLTLSNIDVITNAAAPAKSAAAGSARPSSRSLPSVRMPRSKHSSSAWRKASVFLMCKISSYEVLIRESTAIG